MSQNTFRILVLVSFLISMGMLAWGLITQAGTGYEELDEVYESQVQQIFNTEPLKALLFLGGLVFITLLQLAGVIGVVLFYSWGRYVYCLSLLSGVLLLILIPFPILQSLPEYLLGYVIAMMEGAVVMAMWSNPLQHQFRGVSKEAL